LSPFALRFFADLASADLPEAEDMVQRISVAGWKEMVGGGTISQEMGLKGSSMNFEMQKSAVSSSGW
jgi:hypothetical protein